MRSVDASRLRPNVLLVVPGVTVPDALPVIPEACRVGPTSALPSLIRALKLCAEGGGVTTADAMVIESAAVALAPASSVTFTVKFDVPATVGVPPMVPCRDCSLPHPENR
jgi:hypothetical protein